MTGIPLMCARCYRDYVPKLRAAQAGRGVWPGMPFLAATVIDGDALCNDHAEELVTPPTAALPGLAERARVERLEPAGVVAETDIPASDPMSDG